MDDDPAAVIDGLDWADLPGPRDYDPIRVRSAFHFIAGGRSESEVAWSVASLEDAVGNGHAAVIYPVAAPAAVVMLAVAARWRAEARAQALVSLMGLLHTEVMPGYEWFQRGGVEVEVEQEIRRHVRDGLPVLRSIAADRQPWRYNRKLAIALIAEVADDR